MFKGNNGLPVSRGVDDWGLEPLDSGARRDLYEILEER
jgi:hypothetical protein